MQRGHSHGSYTSSSMSRSPTLDRSEMERMAATNTQLQRLQDLMRVYQEISEFKHEPGLAGFSSEHRVAQIESALKSLFRSKEQTDHFTYSAAEAEDSDSESDVDFILNVGHPPASFLP